MYLCFYLYEGWFEPWKVLQTGEQMLYVLSSEFFSSFLLDNDDMKYMNSRASFLSFQSNQIRSYLSLRCMYLVYNMLLFVDFYVRCGIL